MRRKAHSPYARRRTAAPAAYPPIELLESRQLLNGTSIALVTLVNCPTSTSNATVQLYLDSNNWSFGAGNIDTSATSLRVNGPGGVTLAFNLTAYDPTHSLGLIQVQIPTLLGGGGTSTYAVTLSYSTTAGTSRSSNSLFAFPSPMGPSTGVLSTNFDTINDGTDQVDAYGNTLEMAESNSASTQLSTTGFQPGGVAPISGTSLWGGPANSSNAPGTFTLVTGGNSQSYYVSPVTANSIATQTSGTLSYVRTTGPLKFTGGTDGAYLPLSEELVFSMPANWKAGAKTVLLSQGSNGTGIYLAINPNGRLVTIGSPASQTVIRGGVVYDVVISDGNLWVNDTLDSQGGFTNTIISAPLYFGVDAGGGGPTPGISVGSGATFYFAMVDQESLSPSDIAANHAMTNLVRLEPKDKLEANLETAFGGTAPPYEPTSPQPNQFIPWWTPASPLTNNLPSMAFVTLDSNGKPVVDDVSVTTLPSQWIPTWNSAPQLGDGYGGLNGVIYPAITTVLDPSGQYIDNYVDYTANGKFTGFGGTLEFFQTTSLQMGTPELQPVPSLTQTVVPELVGPVINPSEQDGEYYAVGGFGYGFAAEVFRTPNLANGGNWTLLGAVTSTGNNSFGPYNALSLGGTLWIATQNNFGITSLHVWNDGGQGLGTTTLHDYNTSDQYGTLAFDETPTAEWTNAAIQGPPDGPAALGEFMIYQMTVNGVTESGIFSQGGCNQGNVPLYEFLWHYTGTVSQLMSDGSVTYSIGIPTSTPTSNLTGGTLVWSNPNDWADGQVPNSLDNVVIPAGVSVVQIGPGTFSAGSLDSASPIEVVSGGTLQLLGSSAISGAVTIQPGGNLDVTGATLTLNYQPGHDPANFIASYLAEGYNGGAWNGSGIISSVVAGDNASPNALIYSVGYADGADGIVSGLSSGQIEIMPTLAGDVKLQGNVNFGDFQLLAGNYGSSAGWDGGNFTYGSVVTFGDFQLLAQNFGQTPSLGTDASSAATIGSFSPNTTRTSAPPKPRPTVAAVLDESFDVDLQPGDNDPMDSTLDGTILGGAISGLPRFSDVAMDLAGA